MKKTSTGFNCKCCSFKVKSKHHAIAKIAIGEQNGEALIQCHQWLLFHKTSEKLFCVVPLCGVKLS